MKLTKKEQRLRLRNENQLCENEKNWSDSDVFISKLELFELDLKLRKIKNWDFLKAMSALNEIKVKNTQYRLHYAELDLKDDIPVFGFKKHSQMIDFIDEKCIGRNGQVVWLLASKGSTDVFISENHLSIQDYFTKKYLWNSSGDYFLQEYSSFEDAYSVALNMCEISPLCYL